MDIFKNVQNEKSQKSFQKNREFLFFYRIYIMEFLFIYLFIYTILLYIILFW